MSRALKLIDEFYTDYSPTDENVMDCLIWLTSQDVNKDEAISSIADATGFIIIAVNENKEI